MVNRTGRCLLALIPLLVIVRQLVAVAESAGRRQVTEPLGMRLDDPAHRLPLPISQSRRYPRFAWIPARGFQLDPEPVDGGEQCPVVFPALLVGLYVV
jgi:hypothetical protein